MNEKGTTVEQHKISSLTSAFTLNGRDFRIYLMKKTAEDADVLLVKGKLKGSDVEVTVPVNANELSHQMFKEIAATGITLTGHDLYFCVEQPTDFYVSFNTNGGSRQPDAQVVKYGDIATQPTPNPYKANYLFNGWILGESAYNFATTITSDIELVADWKQPIDVVFDTAGGNQIPKQSIYSGGTVTQPANPTKDGFVFDAWTLDGEAFTFETPITESVAIVATWLEVFTVTFDSQGGSAVAAQEVTDGEVATLPDPAPTKDLYTFTHWSLTEDGAGFAFTTPITADTTLYAIWTLSE